MTKISLYIYIYIILNSNDISINKLNLTTLLFNVRILKDKIKS